MGFLPSAVKARCDAGPWEGWELKAQSFISNEARRSRPHWGVIPEQPRGGNQVVVGMEGGGADGDRPLTL